ncbi:unnamed protein product [Meganyctiphanes norvegica]|uniref:Uncharacterized protein n=1 Tax=Meganyctiphanes norvegica TaxID=48144 RepID=A0AAV2SFB1_MEGNR
MVWRNGRGRMDKIVFQSDLPQYTIWKPNCQYDLWNGNDYAPFENICRIVHFEDFVTIYNANSFTNYYLDEDNHCSLDYPLNTDYEGLFFGPQTSRKLHNWYGNVSFNFSISSFLQNFNLNMFYVETVDYNTNSCSRILLSYKYYHNLRHYNPRKIGGPWYIDNDADHFHLTNARRFDGGFSRFGHALEFMIELPNHCLNRLFNFCQIQAVNHSHSMNGYRKCRKYRTGGFWQRCPSSWGIRYTSLQLRNYEL